MWNANTRKRGILSSEIAVRFLVVFTHLLLGKDTSVREVFMQEQDPQYSQSATSQIESMSSISRAPRPYLNVIPCG